MKDLPLLIITARMGSRRLPGKVLKKIWKDYSILEIIIMRFLRVPEMSRIFLATGTGTENDPVAGVGKKFEIPVIRGPEDDVVERMALCVKGENASCVGRITADNPLTDPMLLLKQWEGMKRAGADYSYCKMAIPGTAADLWTRECFDNTVNLARSPYEREHANAHVWNNKQLYRILWFSCNFKNRNAIPTSLSIDTREDYLKVLKWISSLNKPLEFRYDATPGDSYF